MRSVDAQARRLLERTESLNDKERLKMHGVMRPTPLRHEEIFGSVAPIEGVLVDGSFVRTGDRVRLRPKSRADVFDLVLAGKTAVVEAVEQDAENKVHLAVVLEDDPGKDLGMMRQPGHRFFYGPHEIEPLAPKECEEAY